MGIRFVAIFCLLVATTAGTFVPIGGAVAQDEPDPAELEKQYSRLRYHNFSRHASAVYDTVLRFAQMDQSRLTPGDEFVRAYFESRWDEVRETLAKLPDKFADEVYTKMLTDLTGQNVPLCTLDDFIGLSDACPSELDANRIRRLGLLLRIAVAKEQQLWLKQALKKGTRFFGEKGEKRLTIGRVLMHADFDEMARQYLPNAIEATQLDDAAARSEILRYLESQDELEEFQDTQIAELWKQRAAVLKDPGADTSAKWHAAERLAELVGRAPTPATGSGGVGPWIRNLVETDLDAALQLASALGRRAQGKLNDGNVATRANNLRVQRLLLGHVAGRTNLSQPPWSPIAMAMANWWINEAEHTFLVRPDYPANRKPHVAPGELLDSLPEGDWAKAIPASLAERIDVCRLKIVLLSDHYQDAAAMIVEIAGDNQQAGVTLAEQYLKAWADRHDPEIPEAIRKKHGLPQDARIMVTPLMMEKNIASLAEIMDIFRRNGIGPRNGELLVAAFDVCYSNAEAYRKTHVEKVFGRLDEMDEDVFFHMIRTMTQGLSSRWRKMEVQQASGTRRSQEETLDMVRTGYQTAIDMIDQRSQKHPDAWKIPMLAGSLMSDWGDFEYYQQLADVTPSNRTATDRMEAFRENNNQAEEYFTRAAEIYAGRVPHLDRGRYSIDVYLAWFHSLLGINTSGTLNLSKPLDRRVLGELRQSIRGLPDDAGSAHVDRFAKHVGARMEDTTNPLHKELKYKYLAGSLVITKESPFSFQAGEKVAYYDELLDEVHLQTRVDGPNTIHRDHAFGIVLSVQHTEALGRMANFGKYLVNEAPLRPTPATYGTATYRTAIVQGRRNELEMNVEEALALFFDVESIVFSPADVQPRATDRPGWEETVLAYVYVKAKDSSVDKIPRIQMNLEFLDMAGPVTISAESPETMIKVTDKSTPPRPFSRVEMALTLDDRNMTDTKEVLFEVTATACGLLPELNELLDLDALGRQLPIARIDPSGDTLVRQLNSWGDTVHVVSQRQWSIALDASLLMQNEQSIELRLPAAKADDMAITYQTYVDMDLVDLEAANGKGPVTTIGAGPLSRDTAGVFDSIDPRILYGAAAGTVVLVLLMAIVVVRLLRGPRRRKLRARDLFHMPPNLDGFVVVQLLKALDNSELVRMTDSRRTEMQQEIRRIETTCFCSNGNGNGDGGLADKELRRVARKWLKIAC